MSKLITLKVEIEKLETRADNTVKIIVGTQELSSKDVGVLFGLRKKMVTLGIAENDITPEEIKLLQEAKLSIDDVPKGKSRSMRMRHALYRYWQQHDTGFENSEDHYNDYMDKRTNNIISKLEA